MREQNLKTVNNDVTHTPRVDPNSPHAVLGDEFYNPMILLFPTHTLKIKPVENSAVVISVFIRSTPVHKHGSHNGTVNLSCGINTYDDRSFIISLYGFHTLVPQFV